MRPNTNVSGIFSTNRSRPVSTSMLTKMLVPKPKKAFQSPGVHNAGAKLFADLMTSPICCLLTALSCSRDARTRQRREDVLRARHPAQDAALSLDHFQSDFMEFGKVRSAAIRRHEAPVAAIVSLPHRGVDADLGGHAADDQVVDPGVPQGEFEI